MKMRNIQQQCIRAAAVALVAYGTMLSRGDEVDDFMQRDLKQMEKLEQSLKAATDAPAADTIHALNSFSDYTEKAGEFLTEGGEDMLNRINTDEAYTKASKEIKLRIMAALRALISAEEDATPERKAELKPLLDQLRDMGIWPLVPDYTQLGLDLGEHLALTVEQAADAPLADTQAALDIYRMMRAEHKALYDRMRPDEREQARHVIGLMKELKALRERADRAVQKLLAARDTATPERKAELQQLLGELWLLGLKAPLSEEDILQTLRQEYLRNLERSDGILERASAENTRETIAELENVGHVMADCFHRIPANLIDSFENEEVTARTIAAIEHMEKMVQRLHHIRETATPEQQKELDNLINFIVNSLP